MWCLILHHILYLTMNKNNRELKLDHDMLRHWLKNRGKITLFISVRLLRSYRRHIMRQVFGQPTPFAKSPDKIISNLHTDCNNNYNKN